MKLGVLFETQSLSKTQNTDKRTGSGYRIRMIRFFQTGIIFIYFVPEEEVKSLIENDHIASYQSTIIFEN